MTTDERFQLQWPVDSRSITQGFGENPRLYAKFGLPGHEGLDFQAAVGSSIYACAAGDVLEIRPNRGNAYGLHIRLRHLTAGQEFRTIYAHLSQVLVSEGERVEAGQRIALSGITGYTLGPHLHLTLKRLGAETPGYPHGIVNPLPYLQDRSPDATRSDLQVFAVDDVRLRADPTVASDELAWLTKGEALTVLGDPEVARTRVGHYGEWVHVEREDGVRGYVAAWYLQLVPLIGGPRPRPVGSAELIVYPTEPLNVRLSPSVESTRIAVAMPYEPLEVVGKAEEARAALGDRGSWLGVRLPNDLRGYVAAWYVSRQAGLPPRGMFTVYPMELLNFRERPYVGSDCIRQIPRNTPLLVVDDADRASALVGRFDEWLYVETPEGERGWVAAWYVSSTPAKNLA